MARIRQRGSNSRFRGRHNQQAIDSRICQSVRNLDMYLKNSSHGGSGGGNQTMGWHNGEYIGDIRDLVYYIAN